MSSLRAAITAVSGWVPEDILDNHQLELMVETNDEWIQTRTGIKERRILKKEGAGTSYMATKAINKLLEKRGITANDIDVIICATITPDMLFPSTANLICEQIGATNALSFDLAAACSGFIYALETGSNFIKSGQYKNYISIKLNSKTITGVPRPHPMFEIFEPKTSTGGGPGVKTDGIPLMAVTENPQQRTSIRRERSIMRFSQSKSTG